MIKFFIQCLEYDYQKELLSLIRNLYRTFKARKITDKRRRDRILLFSSISAIFDFISLKSVCLPPSV